MERIGLDGCVAVVTYRGMLSTIRPFSLSVLNVKVTDE